MHRDVSYGNVLVEEGRRFILGDFGSVCKNKKMKDFGALVWTTHSVMSPEGAALMLTEEYQDREKSSIEVEFSPEQVKKSKRSWDG